jgi:Kef-type K+ transport system membrane component KefB
VDITFVNLLGVVAIAFAVPFVLGFFPKLRIPSVVLELMAGIIAGPAVLGWLKPGPVVLVVSNLGVAFLLFLAGLELDLRLLKGVPLRVGAVGFVLSLVLGLAIMVPLGIAEFVLSPLLVATALAATSVGIIIPVLRDTNQLETPTGRFTVAGGSVAEFGTIAVLGVFFAGDDTHAAIKAIFLAVVGTLAVMLLVVVGKFWRWEPGRAVANRLADTTSQVRVRFAVLILVGAAVVARTLGFEAILGTFLAGAVLAMIIRGDPDERLLRRKIEAVGFGFFVPAFFVTSGLKFSLEGMGSAEEWGRVALFLVALVFVHLVPTLLYRKYLSWRETVAAGLLQSTNLSFIVVAVTVGLELGRMQPITGSSLIVAGLLSAVLFPAAAQILLAGAKGETRTHAAEKL